MMGQPVPEQGGAVELNRSPLGKGFARFGILQPIQRIQPIHRIQPKWWQQVRPKPYLPHAPGARMT